MTCLVLALLLSLPLAAAAHAGPRAFSFFAIGDMPYYPGDAEKFDRLIDAINKTDAAFTIHVGDIKSGGSRCTDAALMAVRKQFDRFRKALVYTPGDNEWTDCHRRNAGSYDPRERLAAVRKLFFADPSRSLGRAPVKLVSQAREMPQRFGTYAENARFEKNGVLFATVHVVGSNNNLDPERPWTIKEHAARDAAAVAWIDAAFARAGKSGAKAMVLAWQANVHRLRPLLRERNYSPAFAKVIDAVERGAKAFGRPVLVIHGDFHVYRVLSFNSMSRRPLPKVLRLQVPGARRVYGIEVKVDPDAAIVFSTHPFLVPGND